MSIGGFVKRSWRYLGAVALAIACWPPEVAHGARAKVILHDFSFWNGAVINPRFLADNFSAMEAGPFDGAVVYLRGPGGNNINISRDVMTNRAVSRAAMRSVLSPMAELPFRTLRDNFALVFNNKPADPFDDWSIAIENFGRLAAEIRRAGLKGIVFDNEQYFDAWANYPELTAYGRSKTLAEYEQQVRLRARQIMEAMVEEFPEIVVIVLHGPYVSESKSPRPLFRDLVEFNELDGPFFAGLVEGVGITAKVMDGGALYYLRSKEEFEAAYRWRKFDIASDETDSSFIPPPLRKNWPSRVEISFGVYDTPYLSHAMTPLILRSTLNNAVNQADTYVWFYAESNTFIRAPGNGGADQAWFDAVKAVTRDGSTVTTKHVLSPRNGVAKGSLIVLFGEGLGPDELALAPGVPWGTELSGTRVTLTVDGISIECPIYYAWSKQVAVVVPSQIPRGWGSVDVSYDGETMSAPILVVERLFQIYTQDHSGQGLAVIQNWRSEADMRINGPLEPAVPGQIVILWGTGLGPISGSDGHAPLAGDLGTSVEVIVRDQVSTPFYAGRTGTGVPAIDQINFVVPDVAPGCEVPILVRVDGAESNRATMAIARDGTPCEQ